MLVQKNWYGVRVAIICLHVHSLLLESLLMFFIILAYDRPGVLAKRLEHRQRHLDYWNGLTNVVKIAGALLTDDSGDGQPKGSSFVIEADSLATARSYFANDPFTVEGIFSDRVIIEAFRPSIGTWKPD